MADPQLIPASMSDILQAVETAIVTEQIVTDATLVRWVAARGRPPQLSGGLDILLRYGATVPNGAEEISSGRIGTRFFGKIDVFVRVSYAVDQAGTNKEWVKRADTATYGLIDLLWGMQVVDVDGNQLTVDDPHLTSILPPDKSSDQWGDCVCTLEFSFIPKIDRERYR